jgi:hypothetical protein
MERGGGFHPIVTDALINRGARRHVPVFASLARERHRTREWCDKSGRRGLTGTRRGFAGVSMTADNDPARRLSPGCPGGAQRHTRKSIYSDLHHELSSKIRVVVLLDSEN